VTDTPSTLSKSTPLRIDFHVHLCSYTEQQSWVTDWMRLAHGGDYEAYVARYRDPGAFEAFLAAEGVDYACVLADLSQVTTGICSNEQVREFCRGRSRLIPFCDINPHRYTDLGGELRRQVEGGCRGLKLYPTYQHYFLNEPRLYPLYQAAQELGIPVLIHTGSSVFQGSRLKYGDPLALDEVAVDFPRLNLVMAHSGRGIWYDSAFFLSKLHANLYMEISGLPPKKLLGYFPELAGNLDKVIFGSDWPGMPWIRRNMEAFARLPFPEPGVHAVLGGNAARLLGIEAGGEAGARG